MKDGPKGARGSTVLRAAADLELRIDRGEDGIVRATATKIKDCGPSSPLAFSLADVDLGISDEDGRPVSSAVLEEEEYKPEEGPRAPSGKNQKAAMRIFEEELERHRANVKASGRNASEARVSLDTWRDVCAAAGIDRRRFSEAKAALLAARAIQLEDGYVMPPCPSENPVRIVRRPPPKGGADTDGQNDRRESGEIRTKTGQEPDGDSRQYAASEPVDRQWPKHHRKSGEVEGATWETLAASEGQANELDIF